MSETLKPLLMDAAECTVTAQAPEPDVEGAEQKPRRATFNMSPAYSGGAMRLRGWFNPVVVDLAGLEIKAGIPARYEHEGARSGVGHITEAAVVDNQLVAEGVISRDTAEAREVVESARNGFPWKASVGVSPTRIEEVKAGAKAAANGWIFEGPLSIVRAGSLFEISFVDRGADPAAESNIAATAAETGGHTMPDDSTQPEVTGNLTSLRAEIEENKRREAIEALAVKYVKENRSAAADIMAIAEKSVEDKTVTVQACELEMLRATRATPGISFTTFGSRKPALTSQHYEAALCRASGMSNMERHFKPEVLSQSEDAFGPHGLSLGELMIAMAERNGHRGLSFRTGMRQVLRAAFDGADPEVRAAGFSTVSLPGILGATANKFLLEGFNAVEDTWRLISDIKAVRDFKQITSYRLTGGFTYEEVGAGGELQHAKPGEESYTNQAATYGRMFAVTRTDLINDDLGALSDMPRRIGRGAALKLNNVFWTAFMNNSTFFTAARGNYTTGSTTNLAAAGLKTVHTLFRKLKDSDGDPIALTPRILLVPPDIEVAAAELVNSTAMNTGGSSSLDQAPDANIWRGKYVVASSTYLSNSAYTGNSEKAWYLLASPAEIATVQVVFLNGQQNPTVETADADFDVLGIQFRGYHDFGVSLHDYHGGVKSKGEA